VESCAALYHEIREIKTLLLHVNRLSFNADEGNGTHHRDANPRPSSSVVGLGDEASSLRQSERLSAITGPKDINLGKKLRPAEVNRLNVS
jgi:hypothetical protein